MYICIHNCSLVYLYIRRYSRMYESWGCITVRYTSPSRCLYLDQGVEGGRIARRLASLLSELCVLDNPIIVHCLEVNGVNMYVHLRRVRINKIVKLLVPV